MSWSDLGMDEPGDQPTRLQPTTPAAEPTPPKPPKPPKPEPLPKEPRESGSRTPIVLGIVAAVLLVAVVVALVFALNRTDDTATPVQTSTPESSQASADPTPSASTAPDAVGEPVALTLGATGFTLADDQERTVFTFGWRDDAADAVAELTEAFGAPPSTRVEPGDGSHYPDYTVYQWDGFMLFDMVETDGGTPRSEYAQPSYVLYSRNEIGGIALGAEHEISIGTSIDAVRAASPDEEIPRGNVGAIRFVFDAGRSSAGDPLQYSMFADTDGTAVTAILYYFYSQL